MTKFLFIAILSIIILMQVFLRPLSALVKMDEAGLKNALHHGDRYKFGEIVTSPEWCIKVNDQPVAIVMTPYYMIALATAKAKINGEKFGLKEAKGALKLTETGLSVLDFLMFQCPIYGQSESYLKEYRFQLRQGKSIIKATEVGMDPPVFKEGFQLYFTTCSICFPIVAIDVKSPAIFVIVDPKREEQRYKINLPKIR